LLLKTLEKNLKKIIFFFASKEYIFLIFLYYFDALMSKIILIKYYFNVFISKNYFKKQP